MFVYATPSLQRQETTGRICASDISLLCVRSKVGGKTVPKNILIFVEHSSSEIKDTEMFCATPSFPKQKTTGRTCPLNIYSVPNNFSQVIKSFFVLFSISERCRDPRRWRVSWTYLPGEKGNNFLRQECHQGLQEDCRDETTLVMEVNENLVTTKKLFIFTFFLRAINIYIYI